MCDKTRCYSFCHVMALPNQSWVTAALYVAPPFLSHARFCHICMHPLSLNCPMYLLSEPIHAALFTSRVYVRRILLRGRCGHCLEVARWSVLHINRWSSWYTELLNGTVECGLIAGEERRNCIMKKNQLLTHHFHLPQTRSSNSC